MTEWWHQVVAVSSADELHTLGAMHVRYILPPPTETRKVMTWELADQQTATGSDHWSTANHTQQFTELFNISYRRIHVKYKKRMKENRLTMRRTKFQALPGFLLQQFLTLLILKLTVGPKPETCADICIATAQGWKAQVFKKPNPTGFISFCKFY